MNIVVLENTLRPHGGQEVSLLELCQKLSSRGHRIRLLYKTDGEFSGRYREFCDSMTRVGAYAIDRKRPATVFDFLSSFLKGLKTKPDLIYANQYFDSLYAGLLARACRVPFVCHLRLPPPQTLCFQFKTGLSRAAKLVAVSDHTRERWIRSGFSPARIATVYNGVSLERYAPSLDLSKNRARWGIPSDAFVIAYAGRLAHDKGIHGLFLAFQELLKKKPRAFLILAASSGPLLAKTAEYIESLKNLQCQLPLSNRVLWLENCSDMPALFASSDVTVLPSLWPEPFGRILIESMACGTPAVASGVGGIPEILTGEFSNFIFQPGDWRGLCDSLSKISEWRNTDPELALRCRRHVEEKFNLNRSAGSLEKIFTESIRRS